jgi:predicted DNA repair protein MutK
MQIYTTTYLNRSTVGEFVDAMQAVIDDIKLNHSDHLDKKIINVILDDVSKNPENAITIMYIIK